MAIIDELYGKDVKKEAEEILNTLVLTHKEIINISKTQIDFYGGKTPTTPKDLTLNIQKYEKANAALEKQLERNRLAEIKLQQAREKAFDKYEKQFQKEQQRLAAAETLYSKVNQKLAAYRNEYQELATKKLIMGKIDADEAKRLDFLQGKIAKYVTIHDAVNTSMGKFQQRVGAYASGYNSLSNSINQLTREAPAFANSMQTGFMAISNNLPIFFDAIAQTKKELSALRAEGQQVPGLFSQITSSFLTWGTALSLGVTLLTVFGPQMVEAISGSKERAKALEAEKEALQKKSQAEDEARGVLARYQSEEISKAKILFENAKNVDLPYRKRIDAVKELQRRYPEYLGYLSQEQILAGDTADAELKLNDALVKRGIALASQQAIQDEINNSLKNEKWLNDKLVEIQNKRASLGKEISKIDPFTKNEDLIQQYKDLSVQLTRLFYLEGTLKEQYKDKGAAIQASLKYYLDQYNANSKYIDLVKEDTKATKAKNQEKKIEQESIIGSVDWLEEQISLIKQQQAQYSTSNAIYEDYNKTLEEYVKWLEEITGKQKELKAENEDGILLTDEQVYYEYYAWLKLKDATDEYLKTFSDGYLKEAGLGSLQKFFDGTFDKLIEGADNLKEKFSVTFLAITEVAKEAFSFMSQASKDNFNSEYADLEQKHKIAVMFAGDSATAKEEIDKQYDLKQKEIKNREAKAQKDMALFNIGINTAQGIVSALASTPPNVPLSVAIGIIGALQLAMVASKKIPQYFRGTNFHPGGPMMFNDGPESDNKEIIETPDGKKRIFGGKNLIMDAPRGTKVHNPLDTQRMLRDFALNNMLHEIGGINLIQTGGNLNDLSSLENKLDVLTDTVRNKTEYIQHIDVNGIETFAYQNGERKRMLNKHLRIGNDKLID